MDPLGWSSLKDEQLASLVDERFEEFCFDVIKCEAYDRHDDPDVYGPAGRQGPDGGRDVLLVVKKTPIQDKRAYQKLYGMKPLTEDKGRVAYSCKSGENWFDLALKDLNPKHRKRLTDPEDPGRLIEVLLEGGHVKLLINTVGKLDEKVKRGEHKQTRHAHLAAALWERLKSIQSDAEDPSERIEILDARALADFLRARRPESGGIVRWADALEVRPLLPSLEAWSEGHEEDRRGPERFFEDDERRSLRARLYEFVTTGSDKVAWLVGPPGVGKTRTLIEALRAHPSIAQRALVAESPELATSALRNGLLSRHPSALVIVDDCPFLEVDAVASHFRQAAKASGARLVIVTPGSRDGLSHVKLEPRWFLPALDKRAVQSLVEAEVGDTRQAEEIVRLSQGYPWFATLLSREAQVEGRSPENQLEATKWALASRHEAHLPSEMESLRLQRAKCLLAASLTTRVDWESLSPEAREAIANAVYLQTWPDVMATARACVARGILRRNMGWRFKYVTPLILEREVIAWLLGSDGDDPGGRRLARFGQDYLEDFFETLLRLDLPRTMVAAMARIGAEDLSSAPLGERALHEAGLLGARLMFIARHEPARVARAINERVSALSIEENRARVAERRGLVFALDHLIARRLAFDDAEEALVRLSLGENESYVNNATSTWAGIFFAELNVTYRSYAARVELLSKRLCDADPRVRRLALEGVKASLATQAFRRTIEPLDGDRPLTSPHEAREGRARVWRLLGERFEDLDHAVAAHAKAIAIDSLRGSIRMGLDEEAVRVIEERASTFDDAERMKLREKLVEVFTYDADRRSARTASLARLEELFTARSFQDRLRQHVGTWGPARHRNDDSALDDALAREGLSDRAPILHELDWLTSDHAVRGISFAAALGRRDERGILFEPLRLRARAFRTSWRARLVFVRYLGGVNDAGRREVVDAWLRALERSPEDVTSLAMAIVEVGATEESLAWIALALADGALDQACIVELGRRPSWLAGVSDRAYERFVATLVEGSTKAESTAALELLVDRVSERPADEALYPLLLRAVERSSEGGFVGWAGYSWERGAKILVDRGYAKRVAELAVAALSLPSGSSEHAWNALHHAVERDGVASFRAVAAQLERRDQASGRLLLAFTFHRRSFAWPVDEVMSWVGSNEQRGRMIASLVHPYGDVLLSMVRALITRFGAHSSVASALEARIESTNGVVSSLAEHDARQLERAKSWSSDPDPNVRVFVERLITSLARSYEEHAAIEEDQRRRFGT